ncbi:MAG: hypothetical protein C3F02_01625 [Parcubacteria group bacterium]|nr:MAG: hypothetical protein C3F02_01625 [Parcubacteria group bacterium]
MTRTIKDIEEFYVQRGLMGVSLARALKKDVEYQRLLRIRRRLLLEQAVADKKEAELRAEHITLHLPEPVPEEDKSLKQRAEKFDKKIEDYIKDKINRLIPSRFRKIFTKISR